MYKKRKLQMGVAAVIAMAACSDRVGSPVEPVSRAGAPIGIGAGNPADQGTITVTRTTDVRVPGQIGTAIGASLPTIRSQKTTVIGSGRVALRHEDVRMRAALNAKTVKAIASVSDLNIAGLSFPAGAPSLRESIMPWLRTSPIPGDPEGVIEMSGTGDAPASTITYRRSGAVVAVIEQEWELWKHQWNLVRRDSWLADSSLHDVIEVSRSGRTGAALESPFEWTQAGLRVGAGLPSLDIYDAEYEACDACGTQRRAAGEALANALLKDVLAVAACAFAPLGVTLPVCTAALGIAAEATIKAVRAAFDLEACKSDPPPCPKKVTSTTDCTVRPRGGHTTRPAFDCGATTDDGGTGGAGTTTSSGHWECTYYYEYDLYSGDVLFSQLLYCSWVGGP